MPHHGPVVVHQELLSSAFVQLPLDVLDDPQLDPQDILLLARLLWYAFREPHFPGIPRLAADLRRSKRATQRICRKLQELGWLKLSQRGPGATLRIDLPDPRRRLPRVSWTTPPGGVDATPRVSPATPQGCRGRHPSERLGENLLEGPAVAIIEARARHPHSDFAQEWYFNALVNLGRPPPTLQEADPPVPAHAP